MNKIESLTAEQIALFPKYVDEWTKIGLSTQPADRKAAERAIVQMYKVAGLAKPKIVWCGSPISMGLTKAVIQNLENFKPVKNKAGDSVWASVRASVWASVWASVRDSVWDSVWDSVRDSVGDSVRASVWDSVWDSVGASVRDSVWASVRASVRDSVGDSVRASVRDSVWDSVGASVRDSVWDSVWDSVRDSVGDSVRASVWDSVWASVRASVWASVYGQHDAGWLAFYAYMNEVLKLTSQTKKLNGLWLLAKSAGWALPHKSMCWVSDRHNVVSKDETGRLHNENGPAIEYPDGWRLYSWHGVRVTEDLILHPEKITVEQIRGERNAELRRVMVFRYGLARFLKDSASKLEQSDGFGDLYRVEYPDGAEKFVLAIDPADNTDIVIPVPREIQTAHEGVAWSFHRTAKTYQPEFQS